ncbi:MAG TPA: right-handed parallel beta-helix repeat-containing protein [Streptosporangiaceae bacterium]|nr:right-handed parallel beta-helix repeat-containing protein [Streptosporangiaceae bacterium]
MRGNGRRAASWCGLFGMVIAGSMLTGVTAAYASTTYTVDNTNPSCSDTAGTPFCTIAAAAKKAQAGDTVLVNAGTYAGTSVNPTNSGTAGSPITFTANQGVTISGGTRAFELSSRSYITISGFTITGTSSYGISVSGGGNITISNNTESYAGTPISAPAPGIYLNNVAGGLVQGNVTHDNSAHGIYLTGSTTGVTVQGNTSYHNAYQYERNANGIDDIAPGNSIIGNVTYANEDTGINIYTGGDNALVSDNVSYDNGDHGIDDHNVTGGRIIGNTVYDNCADGINVEGTSGNYNVENNVSMNNATGAVINPTPIATDPSTGQPYYTNLCNRRVGDIGIYDSAPSSTTADYNLVYQSGPGAWYAWAGVSYTGASRLSALRTASGQESQGIFKNPLFVNPSAWNFQLSAGSPAIDSADSLASGEQATDILGNSRFDDPCTPNTGNPAGSYDDRGAYEYQGGSCVQNGPTAALTVSPSSGTAPLAVTADASGSTAGSSPISSYSFNFGDGTTVGPQSGATANHTYQTPGTYTVTVTVTDGNNNTSQATKSVTVNAHMAAYVNSIATNDSTSTHTSESMTVWRTGGVAAGDLMVVTVQLTGTSGTGAVTATDSKGDTLAVASDISDSSGDRLVTLYGVAANGLAVNDTITAHFPAAASNRVTADEVSGASTVDQQSAASGSGSTFSSGATGTTSSAGEFVFATVGMFGGTSLGWDPGWRVLTTYTMGSTALGRAYQVPSSTGSFTATGSASGNWLAEVVAFQ